MAIAGPIISIEDDPDDQHLIEMGLRASGILNELHFFSDGETALNYLLTTCEKPLLILCDINLPLMNGLQTRQSIQANDYLRKKAIPFIFLTTTADPDVVAQAYELTVQGFYQKAPNFDQFQEQLRLIVTYWKICLHPNSNS